MKRKKLDWRFRKRSEADPFNFLPCGCKFYVYDGTVVRHCKKHEAKVSVLKRIMGSIPDFPEETACGKERAKPHERRDSHE